MRSLAKFKGVFKQHYLFLLLIPIVIITQNLLLAPHLLMGRNDLDDGYTFDFVYLAKQYPNILDFVIQSYLRWEKVYIHQFYYPGILNMIFGDNIIAHHTVTHIFKILGTIASYFPFYIISGSSLVAFISALLFGYSYAGIGSFDSIAQSSDYPAIFILMVFLSIYFYMIKTGKVDFIKFLLSWVFMMLALLFSTERTYPIVFLILVVEVAILMKDKTKRALMIAIKRAGILLLPIMAAALLQPNIILVMLAPSWRELIKRVTSGQQELLLVPFISFSTSFFPSWVWDYRRDFAGYAVLLIAFTAFCAFTLSKKSFRFMIITLSFWITGIILVWLLSSEALYFVAFGKMAIGGFYILGLTAAFFLEWLKNKELLYFGLFLAPLSCFIFVFGIWAGIGDRMSIPRDTHRYLSTSAIFASFFLGNLIAVLHKKITGKAIASKILSIMILGLVIPVLLIGNSEIKQYFEGKLSWGLARSDQINLRNQMWPYYQNLDPQNRRLFYMDMITDHKNNAIYGNGLFASYDAWPLWWPHLRNFRKDQMPVIERDLENIKVISEDGQQFLLNRGKIYKAENFYAFILKDKKVIEITDEIKKTLGVEK